MSTDDSVRSSSSHSTPAESAAGRTVFQRHEREFEQNRFVYPVVSRRSQGLSIGVNLNPDRVCNFDCIYCQVNRRSESDTRFVDMDQLLDELRHTLEQAVSGQLFECDRLRDTPPSLRRLNDIAFSGDGEPTTFVNFDEILARVADLKQELAPSSTRMVLITNASMFHRDHVQRGLQILDENQGQIWAKLDAGTENYFQTVDRTRIPFQRILDNIQLAAQQRPVVIQSLFMRVHGEPAPEAEILAWCERLNHIREQGGQIELVQIYTVARLPAEAWVTSLTSDELQRIADQVRARCQLPAEVFA